MDFSKEFLAEFLAGLMLGCSQAKTPNIEELTTEEFFANQKYADYIDRNKDKLTITDVLEMGKELGNVAKRICDRRGWSEQAEFEFNNGIK